MVANDRWGPPLWRLLHTLAERLGRQTIRLLETDERRAWVALLRAVQMVMPCAKCRAHYKAWRTSHPTERFMTSYDLRADAREWLWALHEEVNREKGITGPTLEEISTLYGSRAGYEIQEDLRVVLAVFQQAVLERHIPPETVHAFRNAVSMLRRFSG
jgi:hypothetical protein